MLKKPFKNTSHTGVYLAMLSNHLFLFVLLYLENLCIFITILNVLLQQISVVFHTSFSLNFSIYTILF